MKSSAIAVGLTLSAAVLFSAATSQAVDRRVTIINDTSKDITEFYAANAGSDDWQENIFAGKVLPAGGRVVVNIDDGTGHCLFGFKAVVEGGATAEKENNNVCELHEFTFTE